MEIAIIYIALVLVGVCLGSFAGATVWRLRARQLVLDKKEGEEYDEEEYRRLKKLTKTTVTKDRSQCLHCSYTLRWYDLVPVISWLSLRGKCRNCHKPIGYLEPLIEVAVALFFVLSYAFWPYPLDSALAVAQLVVWLIAGVTLAILFAYDAKWFLLPDKVSFTLMGLGLVTVVLVFLQSVDIVGDLVSIGGSVAILSGLYLFLYWISKGKWIGFGDIKLGLGLALLLANYQLAFVALFAANLIGCLLVIPLMASGKVKRDTHIPFGPLMILGAIFAQLIGFYFVDLYLFSVF